MPELPEVETIKNDLLPRIAGRTINAVRIYDHRPLQGLAPGEFAAGLIGEVITGLSRRGKYLVFGLSSGWNLIIHLRMTGALLWNPRDGEPFTRAEFTFDDGSMLVYADVRRFGTFNLVPDQSDITGKLGIEPFDRVFSPAWLKKALSVHDTPIKSVILKQDLIAGIGNMYADEALFAAKIHPQRAANSLDAGEIHALHRSIIGVLKKGIRNKGASIRNYRCPDGGQGTAHREFCVAHREGDPCPGCGQPVSRIVVGQRGTYFCGNCQKSVRKTK
jgi:formamidopyrimidine-DNA glycosylase